ncbi:ADP-ribosylglycohydrolase family protein [Chitinophaga nivalis]|uniref:ADP-ribosylglycohydrolase family protein n=1 Tax=Chitinophaga nivalis TaxID=2991709 RepID=A0ABT3IEQ0_9BACT|nr:ADP-ribosylglycohydrolase family protein [Chitinophaga nivalis]MCW3468019.1 ADP-ribosylglycohydrolase family protein [Chitinophaga nivalis]MCW3482290.1 ADP-ribosylglycohydrolase family protein [Chitinophaga nivalis]
MHTQQITGAFYGVAIGDALGVPVEFKTRDYLSSYPITDFTGYGSWNQPPGTFSDDSSLTFCTAESLLTGYHLSDMAERFVQWYQHGYWGAHHVVFDIGQTTRLSLQRVATGTSPLLSGGMEEFENGNGSLMRMMPVALYLAHEPDIHQRYRIVKEISGITHLHFRSVLACFIYVEYLRLLLTTPDPQTAYLQLQTTINHFLATQSFNPAEVKYFDRLLLQSVATTDRSQINSSGYVIHTLESAIWCLLTTTSYSECVLKAVNLGGDTDTTGAVAGALAGVCYGQSGIPATWIQQVARSKDIAALAHHFMTAINKPATGKS